MDDTPRRTRNIERLAAALQDCFDAAVEEGALRTEKRMDERMDGFGKRMDSFEQRMDGFEKRMDKRMDRFEQRVDGRLDKQDATLRMVWKQVKGREPLPIDGGD